ncbi:hypothetical protein OF385_15325 [Glutamicibacter sp. JL.03c]|uniref:hypothetical protein n=1 Tax=Glutamicibacter sp. JL.03c TaxID=2984842 RepID=UPI0021F7ADE0|nr:hypothetical protein [Glutamicibacter sp. JL.03c]UYQ77364.1 hypothetical protein OF385_15325 [Glutamicibacter sp. JL.03c]
MKSQTQRESLTTALFWSQGPAASLIKEATNYLCSTLNTLVAPQNDDKQRLPARLNTDPSPRTPLPARA